MFDERQEVHTRCASAFPVLALDFTEKLYPRFPVEQFRIDYPHTSEGKRSFIRRKTI